MPSNPRTGAAAPIDTGHNPQSGTAVIPGAINPPLTPSPSQGPADPSSGPGAGPSSGPGGGPGDGPGGSSGGDVGGGPSGGPSGGPGSGVGDGSNGSSSGGPGDGGAGGLNGGTQETGTTDTTGSATDSVDNQIAGSLLGLIASATSGDALEAQNIILRRIALEGDVVPSRVPAPRNITEIGGYLNLLGTLNQTEMRSQVLAGILSVAGPNPPVGWITTTPPLSLSQVTNDRPASPLQPSLPLTVPVRSDFAGPLRLALQTLHAQSCLLPFLGGPISLPSPGWSAVSPVDPMPYLGRILTIAPRFALSDPATDLLALVRAQGSTDAFQIAARAQGTGSVGVAPGDYDAVKCTAEGCSVVALNGAPLVLLASALASAGFYAPPLPAEPASADDTAWTRLSNVTGLVPGKTTLGDELNLVYAWSAISGSVFNGMLDWLWNGNEFSPPG